MAIIKGSPSGTAITIITTANIKTSNKSLNTYIIPRSKYGDTPPATITLWIIKVIAITTAPIYPNFDILSANLESLTFNGLSTSSSCMSLAISPIIVIMPTFLTSSTPSPFTTTAPLNKECLSTNVSPVIATSL